jgi:hypothetical protein
VALIQPGWGNKRDKHYYRREILERDAHVFGGVKMYESDHGPDKTTRLWVSTVKGIKGFTNEGAPIAEVSVHDENFAKRLIALQADGLLEKMECSILASGTARKGEVDGRKAHIVEAITSAESVDWVTRAGAGGRALALSEREEGPMPPETEVPERTDVNETAEAPEEEPTETTFSEEETPAEPPAPEVLAPERVKEMVEATKLPDAAKTRLSEAEYADEPAVQAAIEAEVAYIKEVTGSGRPFAQGGGRAPESHKPRTEEERTGDFNRIMREIGAQEV